MPSILDAVPQAASAAGQALSAAASSAVRAIGALGSLLVGGVIAAISIFLRLCADVARHVARLSRIGYNVIGQYTLPLESNPPSVSDYHWLFRWTIIPAFVVLFAAFSLVIFPFIGNSFISAKKIFSSLLNASLGETVIEQESLIAENRSLLRHFYGLPGLIIGGLLLGAPTAAFIYTMRVLGYGLSNLVKLTGAAYNLSAADDYQVEMSTSKAWDEAQSPTAKIGFAVAIVVGTVSLILPAIAISTAVVRLSWSLLVNTGRQLTAAYNWVASDNYQIESIYTPQEAITHHSKGFISKTGYYLSYALAYVTLIAPAIIVATALVRTGYVLTSNFVQAIKAVGHSYANIVGASYNLAAAQDNREGKVTFAGAYDLAQGPAKPVTFGVALIANIILPVAPLVAIVVGGARLVWNFGLNLSRQTQFAYNAIAADDAQIDVAKQPGEAWNHHTKGVVASAGYVTGHIAAYALGIAPAIFLLIATARFAWNTVLNITRQVQFAFNAVAADNAQIQAARQPGDAWDNHTKGVVATAGYALGSILAYGLLIAPALFIATGLARLAWSTAINAGRQVVAAYNAVASDNYQSTAAYQLDDAWRDHSNDKISQAGYLLGRFVAIASGLAILAFVGTAIVRGAYIAATNFFDWAGHVGDNYRKLVQASYNSVVADKHQVAEQLTFQKTATQADSPYKQSSLAVAVILNIIIPVAAMTAIITATARLVWNFGLNLSRQTQFAYNAIAADDAQIDVAKQPGEAWNHHTKGVVASAGYVTGHIAAYALGIAPAIFLLTATARFAWNTVLNITRQVQFAFNAVAADNAQIQAARQPGDAWDNHTKGVVATAGYALGSILAYGLLIAPALFIATGLTRLAWSTAINAGRQVVAAYNAVASDNYQSTAAYQLDDAWRDHSNDKISQAGYLLGRFVAVASGLAILAFVGTALIHGGYIAGRATLRWLGAMFTSYGQTVQAAYNNAVPSKHEVADHVTYRQLAGQADSYYQKSTFGIGALLSTVTIAPIVFVVTFASRLLWNTVLNAGRLTQAIYNKIASNQTQAHAFIQPDTAWTENTKGVAPTTGFILGNTISLVFIALPTLLVVGGARLAWNTALNASRHVMAAYNVAASDSFQIAAATTPREAWQNKTQGGVATIGYVLGTVVAYGLLIAPAVMVATAVVRGSYHTIVNSFESWKRSSGLLLNIAEKRASIAPP